ncbi:zeta toxin family protein (plasmid) [Microbacterium hominis]|uniref:zeta toxin family protein n=1 Tax=Microbacterium hominis TaxID=162426 RepID=UPI0019648A41|nr:zeta toxin family protein [Microbacterium hominis]QRY42320.1 zeta toxin family protein [Microbacterium hominis]
MSGDDVARHMDVVRELSRAGEALAVGAPTASVRNPAWWVDGAPTPVRDRLHGRLLAEVRHRFPDVAQESRALVLAGPPGAGKSTARDAVLGGEISRYVLADADEFKRLLLREAIADGSYDRWLMPDALRELERTADEKFFPLELASLVHAESSYLADVIRFDAISAGHNIVIDSVLKDEQSALALGRQLDAAGYTVSLVDVEVSYALSEQRIRSRWAQDYQLALTGTDPLGGRWVPSEYARDVFDGAAGKSKPEAVAARLAQSCPAVMEYRVFRTTDAQVAAGEYRPTLEVHRERARHDGALVSPAEAVTLRATASQRRAASPEMNIAPRSSGPEIGD